MPRSISTSNKIEMGTIWQHTATPSFGDGRNVQERSRTAKPPENSGCHSVRQHGGSLLGQHEQTDEE